MLELYRRGFEEGRVAATRIKHDVRGCANCPAYGEGRHGIGRI